MFCLFPWEFYFCNAGVGRHCTYKMEDPSKVKSLKEEFDLWNKLSQRDELEPTVIDRAFAFSEELKPVLKAFAEFEKKTATEAVDALDSSQDRLDNIWKITQYEVYPQPRMERLFELMGKEVERWVEEHLPEDLSGSPIATLRDAIQEALQVIDKLEEVVNTLAGQLWATWERHQWVGAPPQPLHTVHARLTTLQQLRSRHELVRRLPSQSQSSSQAPTELPPLTRATLWSGEWPAAVKAAELALRPAEEPAAERLQRSVTQLREYPAALLREWLRWAALVAQPAVRQRLSAERDVLAGQLRSYVGTLRNDFSNRSSAGDESVASRNLSEPVRNIVWGRQLFVKVQQVVDAVQTLLSDLKESKSLLEDSKALLDDLKAWEVEQVSFWQRDLEDALSDPSQPLVLERTGQLMELDLKDGALRVNYSERMVTLLREVRQLSALGIRIPRDIRNAADNAQKFYRHGVVLKQVANFYNSVFTQLIPSQKGMLLDAALAFEDIVKHPKLSSSGQVTWSNPAEVESYIEKLQQAAERITSENRKLRKYHSVIGEKVVQLMNVDLLRYQEKWKELAKEIKGIMDNLENQQGYKNMKLWRLHWDHQLYKALEFQYRLGLESLNENHPEIHVELVYKQQQLQFRPPFEEIRAKYYNFMKKFIKFPDNFGGENTIFKHMADRNAPSLIVVYRKAEDLFRRLQEEKVLFEEWVAPGSVNLESFLSEHLVDVTDWEINFKMLKQRGRAAEKLPSERKLDCIKLSFAPVRATIDDLLQRLADSLVSTLRKSINGILVQLDEFTSDALDALSKRPSTVEEISQVTETYQNLVEERPKMVNLLTKVENMNKFLRSVAGSGVNMLNVQSKWENFVINMEYHETMVKEQLDEMKGKVDGRMNTFTGDLNKFSTRWNDTKPSKVAIQDRETAKVTLLAMKDVRNDFLDLKATADGIAKDCKMFGMETPVFPGLDTLDDEIQHYEESWNFYETFTAELDQLSDENWFSIRNKLYLFEDFLNNWSDKLKGTGADAVGLYLRSELEKLTQVKPLLKHVRGDALTQDHWAELYRMLGMERGQPMSALTLGSFLRVTDALLAHVDQVKELAARAQGEITIREAIQELKGWAADTEFTLVEHSDNGRVTSLIKEWKDLMTQVGDNQSLLNSLKDSPYYKLFIDEASRWENALGGLAEFLLKLNNVQRRWVYLEPIFGRGALPQEQPRFNKVDSEFRSIMSFVEKERKVISLTEYSGIRDTLNMLVDQLERCQKALNEFLEEKRASFPRFYFIGDDDLLEILGQAKNPVVIQAHLKKLFQGINSVDFSDNKRQIIAMKSSAGEYVALQTPVGITDNVEEWLMKLSDEMKTTLKQLLIRCLEISDITQYPSQVLCTAESIHFTQRCEMAIQKGILAQLHKELLEQLDKYTSFDPGNDQITRIKVKALVLDIIHNMDVVDQLQKANVTSIDSWVWQRQLRFYMDDHHICKMRMCDAEFDYTYEYQGNAPKLVHTPLTDKCYLTLTQAMANGFGGNPYGPAGTGKTESVKALGQLFARQVLVFNCDEGIDFKSMGRIFTGIVKCGAWGCFDEFNRLDEEVLSAVSQQIQVIQSALKNKDSTMNLLGSTCDVDANAGIFVTLNPAGKGYGGRSKLPDNLKQLFRSVAMSAPDLELIAEVILYSEGFMNAKQLGLKLVSIFKLSKQLLTPQQHYDWGLRALKTILNVGGQILQNEKKSGKKIGPEEEMSIVVQALRVNTLSKLTFGDTKRFNALVEDVFPSLVPKDVSYEELEEEIKKTVAELKLDLLPLQLRKILQFYEALNQRMGVVIVGPGGCGKSTLWKILKMSLLKQKKRVVQHTMNPKALPRQQLLGHMDLDTREWFNGVLTAAARDAVKEPSDVNSWIICDGDIDPEWIESLNSVLDDNRLLTLPSGERIQFGSNVNFIFETHSLKWASPATVSRMGMIFLADEDMDNKAQINSWIRQQPSEDTEKLRGWIDSYFMKGIDWITQERSEIVETTRGGLIMNGLSQLKDVSNKGEFISAMIRGLGSNLDPEKRSSFARDVFAWTGESPVDKKRPLNSYYDSNSMTFRSYEFDVTVEIPPSQVVKQPVVPTVEISSNADIILPWLRNGDPFILVGPEGCGKSVLLRHCFDQLKSTSVAILHCNSQTTAAHVIQKINQSCNMYNSNKGRVFRPKEGERLILFLKDINLPKPDKYETIQLVSFLQQLVSYNGFYADSLEWLGLERVQLVCSMTPSATVGRYPLTTRFTSLMRICYVGYPSKEQLQLIYSTYIDGALSGPDCDTMWRSKQNKQKLAAAIVDIYEQTKSKFSVDDFSHYRFTPRELTKWVLGLLHYDLENQDVLEVMAYEGSRLLADRLVDGTSRQRFSRIVESVFRSHFNTSPDLQNIFFTSLTSSENKKWGKLLVKVSTDDLKEVVSRTLVAYEREVRELSLIVFSELMEHVVRLDRLLAQPGGAALLVGVPGVGRRSALTVAAHAQNMRLVSLNISKSYSVKHFKNDLKQLMQVAGVEGDHVILFMEDHQFIQPEFIEIVNSLLSSGEVPGLYAPEELEPLLSPLKDKVSEEGFFGTPFQFFVDRVKKHLHVILSMDPRNEEFQRRCEANPALFTQCNIQWWEGWSGDTMRFIPLVLLKGVVESNKEVIIKQLLQVHELSASLDATPRNYITLLETFKKIYQTKRSSALEQQSHLQAGLSKLQEASQKVDVLSHDAEEKKVLLAEKQEQANQALEEITKSMDLAADQRKEMKTLEEKLSEERIRMEARKSDIEHKLSDIQPILDTAREAVGSIRSDHLTEIRSLKTPPEAIRHVLSGVLRLMGNLDNSWNAMKSFLGNKGVKDQIMNFDAHRITPEIRKSVQELIKSKSSAFEDAVIRKSSQAAAPLAAWVKAVIQYSTVLESIAPMEKDLKKLTKNLNESEKKVKKLQDDLSQLDQKVSSLKDDFAKRTQEASDLKSGLIQAEKTLEAAQSLLSKLGGEKERWDATVIEITKSLETLPSNSILAAAFVTYLGGAPEDLRASMVEQWSAIVGLSQWNFRQFMSTESELLVLKSEGLPADDLSMENAIVIQQCVPIPFIIDPSTQASQWLKVHLKDSKLDITSQEDERFNNTLELAVRFGKTIIVEEVDKIHPVLYPLLRKDLMRQGPRWMVQVGDKAVDYNEEFRLFLVTRNSDPIIPPDVASLICTVNFTTTRSGLEGQLLGLTIKHEKPELEEKKTQLLLVEEEQKVELSKLEKDLLSELTSSKGNILENKALLDSLNETKSKSLTIANSLQESGKLQVSLDKERNLYRKIAINGSALYFTISDLQKVNHMYQFSLGVFLQLFHRAMEKQADAPNVDARISQISDRLEQLTFEYVGRSLFKSDRLMFGLHLVHAMYPKMFQDQEWELFTGKIVADAEKAPADFPTWASPDRKSAFALLQSSFPSIVHSLNLRDSEAWSNWGRSTNCETEFPVKYATKVTAFQRILLLQALRPDRLESAMTSFVCEILKVKSLSPSPLNLDRLYKEESSSQQLILIVISPGTDPSQELEELAGREVGKDNYHQIAMGQGQAEIALSTLRNTAAAGGWLCLKNLHLAISWLPTLEKELNFLKPHENFRLWVTTEPHPKFSPILLKTSLKVTFESPPGVKKNLQRSYETWSSEFIGKGSVLRAQAIFSLAWFHAIIQERRNYIPQGWSKFYEYSFADLRSSAELIDKLCTNSNAPEWSFVHGLLENAIYGGRVDNEYDARVLRTYLQNYFNSELLSTQPSRRLTRNITLPNSTQHEAYMAVINQLPEDDSPSLFQLPMNIDRALQRTNSAHVIGQLKLLNITVGSGSRFNREKWSNELSPLQRLWQTLTSSDSSILNTKPAATPSGASPVDTFVYMENEKAFHTAKFVNTSVQLLGKIISGTALLSAQMSVIGTALLRGEVPDAWSEQWEGPSDPFEWIRGLVFRATALQKWLEKIQQGSLLKSQLDLSELFRPDTFLNALRQQTARATKCPVDGLKLISSQDARQLNCALPVTLTGLLLQGSNLEGGRLSEAHAEAPTMMQLGRWSVGWVPSDSTDPFSAAEVVTVPLYSSAAREEIIAELRLPSSGDHSKWILAGTALFVSE